MRSPGVGDFRDPRLAGLLVHWQELRDRAAPSAIPPSTMLDPTNLVFILGWLMILEPIERGADFRYRLYGSKIASITGHDYTGQKVSDSVPDFAHWTSAIYRSILAEPEPVLTRHTSHRVTQLDQWERLILPFAGAGGAVDRLLVGAIIMAKLKESSPVRGPWPRRE
jgi:hypothetical protein